MVYFFSFYHKAIDLLSDNYYFQVSECKEAHILDPSADSMLMVNYYKDHFSKLDKYSFEGKYFIVRKQVNVHILMVDHKLVVDMIKADKLDADKLVIGNGREEAD